jgi:hypothetical protein
MHGIAAVLLQIGAGFVGKQVLRRQGHGGQARFGGVGIDFKLGRLARASK